MPKTQNHNVIILLFVVTFLVIMPMVSRELVFSPYFHGVKNDTKFLRIANERNEERLRNAVPYLKDIQKPSGPRVIHSTNSTGINITIGIITTSRPVDKIKTDEDIKISTGYLSQVLATFHEQIHMELLDFGIGTNVFVCNVESGNREANEWRGIFPTFSKFSPQSSDPGLGYKREYDDYGFCLKTALEMAVSSQYVILVQDDAIPRHLFFKVLHKTLSKTIRPYEIRSGEKMNQRPFGSIKLYYPPKWSGYSFTSRTHIMELLKCGTLGGSLWMAVYLIFNKRSRKRYDLLPRTVFLLGALYSICLVNAIGRPYIMNFLGKWEHFYRMSPGQGCCIPAVVYPTQVAKDLVPYLASTNETFRDKHHVDIALDLFMNQHNLMSYNVEPNLVRHIGMVSTLNNNAKKAAEFIYLL